jgi:hypothetical protein
MSDIEMLNLQLTQAEVDVLRSCYPDAWRTWSLYRAANGSGGWPMMFEEHKAVVLGVVAARHQAEEVKDGRVGVDDVREGRGLVGGGP